MSPEPPASVDVAIVGAGPAGARCGELLAGGSASVALVGAGPRHAEDVELLSAPARRAFEPTGPPLAGREVVETVSAWDGAEVATQPAMLNPWGAGLAVRRGALHEAARARAAAAGARTIDAAVRAVHRDGGGWRLTLAGGRGELRARFLVLASGRSGPRALGRRRSATGGEVALTAHVDGESAAHPAALLVEAIADGWCYALPRPGGGRFAAVVLAADRVRDDRRPPATIWAAALRRSRLLSAELPAAAPPLGLGARAAGTCVTEPAAGDGWAAVGDAAFMHDPLSGQGIAFALACAQRASEVACGRASAADHREWVRWCREEHDEARRQLRAIRSSPWPARSSARPSRS